MNLEFTLIDEFFKENTIVQHHIDSFNEFLDISLPVILREYECVNIDDDSRIALDNIVMHNPNHVETNGTCIDLSPNEARLRNLTYASNVMVDITIHTRGEITSFSNVVLCKLPIMIGSKLCNDYRCNQHDKGGYFIVNGSEKVLISQEKMINNLFFVFDKKSSGKYTYSGELRSIKENDQRSSNTLHMFITQPNAKYQQSITVQLASMRTDVSLVYLFVLLDFKNKQTILNHFQNEDRVFMELILNHYETITKEDAIKSFESKIVNRTKDTVDTVRNDFVYAVPELKLKQTSLIHMIHQLLACHFGRRKEDDRDHFKNKRVETAGQLYTGLFRQLLRRTYKEFVSNTTKFIQSSKLLNIQNLYKSKIVTNGLRYSLSTGNWGVGGNVGTRSGISQVYNRLTIMSSISHMRRINSPVGRDGKLMSPRHLHNSHWGKVCPAETPEGATCGLVKNMALLSTITIYADSTPIKHIINAMIINEPLPSPNDCYLILINGVLVNQTRRHVEIFDTLKWRKTHDELSPYVGVCLDDAKKEIRIHTDAGRVCRPLLVVNPETGCLKLNDEHVKPLKFSKLVREGYVEYIDCDEEEFILISQSVKTLTSLPFLPTHCEIHPSVILGTSAMSIPFADHNQSPRNTYQSAMGKQAIGLPTVDYRTRMDTLSHVLCYPQKPLVSTIPGNIVGLSDLPAGQNAIVAIASYTGYNQEDSIIMNKGSIDRGMFRSIVYRTYKEETKIHGSGMKETIEVPHRDECIDIKLANYNTLGEDGIVECGQCIKGNDVLIGKTIMSPDLNGKKRDCSTIVKPNDDGVVDRVMTSTNENGSNLLKVRVRKVKIPQIGDKFSARHGQKGTIGMIYNEEDMPFSSKDGIRPDIIINPHAIPSRMTIGQLLECIFGKVASLDGQFRDSTAFEHDEGEIHDLYESLHKQGFQRHGSDMLINGMTGKQMPHSIFIGPTYYQRLKHMVEDKIHSRGTGPVQLLTRQPVEGRARDGGLRTGEMERDAMISHGTAMFMKDRLFYNSDAYRIHVCSSCGLIVSGDIKNNRFFCKICVSPKVKQISIPFATKLLFQELMSIGATPRIGIGA